MTAVQKLFFLALAFCVSLGAAIGIFLYLSLVPYFGIIGKFAAGLLAFALCCTATLIGVFTWSQVGIMLANRERAIHHRRVITAGEVVAYLNSDGNFTHLSALHEAAKLAPQVTVKEIAAPKPVGDKDTVLELYDQGLSLRKIAEATNLTYHAVQKITSEAKKEVIDRD